MEDMDTIYCRYADIVYRFLLSRTRNPEEAEELTQETFYQAMRMIDTFKEDSSLSTWLCAIAKNVWLSSLRKQKKTVTLAPDSEAFLTESKSPLDGYLQKEKLSETWKAIYKLEEPYKEVLLLRILGEFSYSQIGELMGKSENWARVTFFRGKEKIIKELKKYE